MEQTHEKLLNELEHLRLENKRLKEQLSTPKDPVNSDSFELNGLTFDEYERYGRQMIVPEFRIAGQLKLKRAKILVVGAGGLGCPALLYLAGAGIGEIGIIDDDRVDVSNLHRQVLHSTETVGEFKCLSAKKYLNRLNPNVKINTYPFKLTNSNGDMLKDYDYVLDCTDSPFSRYLINDLSCLYGKTIISGSGLKTEGQLSILNFKNIGPCYRCFYPKPPPPNSITSCKDGGVIGPVIGLIGVMMAIETIKVITDVYTTENFQPFLLSYSSYDKQVLKNFKMRNKKQDCISCNGNLSLELINNINYSEFCGIVNYDVLNKEDRISVVDYNNIKDDHILIDVRPSEQYEILNLPNSINLPIDILKRVKDVNELQFDHSKPIFVICRFGNDSQYAVKHLNDTFNLNSKDIIGGLNQYIKKIDNNLPTY